VWRGRARRRRAGQAFEIGKTGRDDRDHRRFLAADHRGPPQDDQAVKPKPLTGAACRFWIRAWGQREPALQGTGRLSGSALWLGLLKGGLDMPATHAECGSLQREHSLWTLTRRAWSRAGRIGNAQFASHRSLPFGDALPVVPQPIKQGPGHGAIPFRDGRPFCSRRRTVVRGRFQSNPTDTAVKSRPCASLPLVWEHWAG